METRPFFDVILGENRQASASADSPAIRFYSSPDLASGCGVTAPIGSRLQGHTFELTKRLSYTPIQKENFSFRKERQGDSKTTTPSFPLSERRLDAIKNFSLNASLPNDVFRQCTENEILRCAQNDAIFNKNIPPFNGVRGILYRFVSHTNPLHK